MAGPLSIRSFPRAIVHVDGDAFFASCEQMKDSSLRGKPVVTGLERGIASSMSYEAKALGVTRAMPLHEIRRLVPNAIILPSDYESYSLMSLRMYEIVRRYTSEVEEYSIDECFADITGLRRPLRMNYFDIARAIKRDLDTELGVTFSVGLAPSKVLAKVASKWQKPSGITFIAARDAHEYLQDMQVGKLWGIGPQTSLFLNKRGIHTALQFAHQREAWVKENLSKPYQEIWYELHGEYVLKVHTEKKIAQQSISKTRTFTPPSKDRAKVFAQLAKNVENACIKARRYKQASRQIYAYLKTQDFRYRGFEVELPQPTSIPGTVIEALREPFEEVFRPGLLYRATGVTLVDLEPELLQPDLFGSFDKELRMYKIYEQTDKVSEKYGKHTVYLGSSFLAHKMGLHQTARGHLPKRQMNLLKGESKRKRIDIPLMGEAK